jgi:hypothetical protein
MQLTNEEKSRSVLCRTGSPFGLVENFVPAEIEELASVYDTCAEAKSDEPLARLVMDFWARRAERLEALKATDQVQERGARSEDRVKKVARPAFEAPNAEPKPVTGP